MRGWIDDDNDNNDHDDARSGELASDLQRLPDEGFISIMNPQRLFDELLTKAKTTSVFASTDKQHGRKEKPNS